MLTQLNRLQQILIGLLVVQAGLAAFVFWPSNAASPGGGPLLANFQADQVTAVTISDAEGSQVALAQKDGAWVLAEAGDYPATGDSVTELLENLAAVETNRLVTQTEGSHQRLQVANDDFNRKITLSMQDGSTQEILVGSAAGAGATHVRASGQPEVFLTAELNSWEINNTATNWIDTLYFTVPQTATVGLTLENQNGTFEFKKAEDDTWQMVGLAEDETINESELTSLLNQARSIRMTEPIGVEEEASFGLDSPQATITLETPDETYTLMVGAQAELDSSYVFKASNSPYYVRVAQFTGQAFTDKSREDFIAPPPEVPAVESGGSQSQ